MLEQSVCAVNIAVLSWGEVCKGQEPFIIELQLQACSFTCRELVSSVALCSVQHAVTHKACIIESNNLRQQLEHNSIAGISFDALALQVKEVAALCAACQ